MLSNIPLLTTIIFLPALGGAALLFFKREQDREMKIVGLIFSLVTFLISLALYFKFPGGAGFAFVEDRVWIDAFNIHYKVGIDGISLFLVLLTTFLTPICVLASFTYIHKREKEFYAALLFLETAMIGTLCAMDLFMFYVFWEAMLIPMYFLIGVWGGERRIYAAIKFFLFTMVGSLLMFVAILYVYNAARPHTFDVVTLYTALEILTPKEQWWLFLAFAFSFAIKVPMFPLHTWLPDAHVEAPTAGSVILAGVLLKMGTYGFLRFAIPFFPGALVHGFTIPVLGVDANFLGCFTVLAVVGIIYGALMALAQDDMKKLIAYSSVSHLGFVMLGLFALNVEGVTGGLYQMLNHGVSTGALFLIVGILYERRHTREISEYGGIARKVPVFAAIYMIVTLSSIGLPLTNGFVGEFTILLGAFMADPWYAVFAASGVVLGAVYMLWLYQRVMFGKLNPANNDLTDVNPREIAYMVPLIVMIFVMGVFPGLFFRKMEPSVDYLLRGVVRERLLSAGAGARKEVVSRWTAEACAPSESAGKTVTDR